MTGKDKDGQKNTDVGQRKCYGQMNLSKVEVFGWHGVKFLQITSTY